MEDLKERLHSINEQLNEDCLTNEKIEALLKKKSSVEYKIQIAANHGIVYCYYCAASYKNWQKHENTTKHHENRWKDK
tara:strand:- start:254 stop:487 length:234 start_codon:yes stop_codon:yes gene_type:complete